MNWQKIHNQIIDRAKTRQLKCYKERHHIIPKCLGGSNDKKNIVELTAREHFIIHKILTLLYPSNTKLHWAAFRMSNSSGNKNQNREYRIGSREYQRLRENVSHSPESIEKMRIANTGNKYRLGTTHSTETKKLISKKAIGRVSPRKGEILSDETKKKLSMAAKKRKRNPHSEETKERIRLAWAEKKKNGFVSKNKGKRRSDETKKKISKSKTGIKRPPITSNHKKKLSESLKGKAKGKIWINNGTNASMIPCNQPIPIGWVRGMLKRR